MSANISPNVLYRDTSGTVMRAVQQEEDGRWKCVGNDQRTHYRDEDELSPFVPPARAESNGKLEVSGELSVEISGGEHDGQKLAIGGFAFDMIYEDALEDHPEVILTPEKAREQCDKAVKRGVPNAKPYDPAKQYVAPKAQFWIDLAERLAPVTNLKWCPVEAAVHFWTIRQEVFARVKKNTDDTPNSQPATEEESSNENLSETTTV